MGGWVGGWMMQDCHRVDGWAGRQVMLVPGMLVPGGA